MALSRFETEQYTSEAFVESAGAIPFRLSSKEICVIHLLNQDEYVLPKGRRNCGESRQTAALREIMEETGLSCRLLPLTMPTRAPPAVETEQTKDEVRVFANINEPFTLQIRRLDDGIKLIWWYIAAINEDEPLRMDLQESEKFAVKFYSYKDVLDKLTFQMDRDMVKSAIDLVNQAYETEPTA